MHKKTTKILAFLLSFLLIFEQSGFAQVANQLNIQSYLVGMGNSFVVEKFRPVHLRYLSLDSKNNTFNLLLDKGDLEKQYQSVRVSEYQSKSRDQKIKEETLKLLNYFLVGITLPNDSFWVNLRPDSQDNVIDDHLALTDVGKILLEADLQLKKDTAGFTNPNTPTGKLYWDKLYKKAGDLYGLENISIPTLTRPWIVPGEVIISENKGNAYIYKATLKVMLESDYLKTSGSIVNSQVSIGHGPSTIDYSFKDPRQKILNEYSSQLIRELIIPKLNKEINNAKRYAALRQVYYSLIMAQWFKARYRLQLSANSYQSSAQNNPYIKLIDSKNLNGLGSKRLWSKTEYFNEYKKSFSEGEYNTKNQIYTPFGQSIRSYFSGGMNLSVTRFPVPPNSTNPQSSSLSQNLTCIYANKRIASNLRNNISIVVDNPLGEAKMSLTPFSRNKSISSPAQPFGLDNKIHWQVGDEGRIVSEVFREKAVKAIGNSKFIENTVRKINPELKDFSYQQINDATVMSIGQGVHNEALAVVLSLSNDQQIKFVLKIAYGSGKGDEFLNSVVSLDSLNDMVPELVPTLGAVDEEEEFWSEEYINTNGKNLLRWRKEKVGTDELSQIEQEVVRAYYLFCRDSNGYIQDPKAENFVIYQDEKGWHAKVVDVGKYYKGQVSVLDIFKSLTNIGKFSPEAIFTGIVKAGGKNELRQLLGNFPLYGRLHGALSAFLINTTSSQSEKEISSPGAGVSSPSVNQDFEDVAKKVANRMTSYQKERFLLERDAKGNSYYLGTPCRLTTRGKPGQIISLSEEFGLTPGEEKKALDRVRSITGQEQVAERAFLLDLFGVKPGQDTSYHELTIKYTELLKSKKYNHALLSKGMRLAIKTLSLLEKLRIYASQLAGFEQDTRLKRTFEIIAGNIDKLSPFELKKIEQAIEVLERCDIFSLDSRPSQIEQSLRDALFGLSILDLDELYSPINEIRLKINNGIGDPVQFRRNIERMVVVETKKLAFDQVLYRVKVDGKEFMEFIVDEGAALVFRKGWGSIKNGSKFYLTPAEFKEPILLKLNQSASINEIADDANGYYARGLLVHGKSSREILEEHLAYYPLFRYLFLQSQSYFGSVELANVWVLEESGKPRRANGTYDPETRFIAGGVGMEGVALHEFIHFLFDMMRLNEDEEIYDYFTSKHTVFLEALNNSDTYKGILSRNKKMAINEAFAYYFTAILLMQERIYGIGGGEFIISAEDVRFFAKKGFLPAWMAELLKETQSITDYYKDVKLYITEHPGCLGEEDILRSRIQERMSRLEQDLSLDEVDVNPETKDLLSQLLQLKRDVVSADFVLLRKIAKDFEELEKRGRENLITNLLDDLGKTFPRIAASPVAPSFNLKNLISIIALAGIIFLITPGGSNSINYPLITTRPVASRVEIPTETINPAEVIKKYDLADRNRTILSNYLSSLDTPVSERELLRRAALNSGLSEKNADDFAVKLIECSQRLNVSTTLAIAVMLQETGMEDKIRFDAVDVTGQYKGAGQFSDATGRKQLEIAKQMGLLPETTVYDPMDPVQAGVLILNYYSQFREDKNPAHYKDLTEQEIFNASRTYRGLQSTEEPFVLRGEDSYWKNTYVTYQILREIVGKQSSSPASEPRQSGKLEYRRSLRHILESHSFLKTDPKDTFGDKTFFPKSFNDNKILSWIQNASENAYPLRELPDGSQLTIWPSDTRVAYFRFRNQSPIVRMVIAVNLFNGEQDVINTMYPTIGPGVTYWKDGKQMPIESLELEPQGHQIFNNKSHRLISVKTGNANQGFLAMLESDLWRELPYPEREQLIWLAIINGERMVSVNDQNFDYYKYQIPQNFDRWRRELKDSLLSYTLYLKVNKNSFEAVGLYSSFELARAPVSSPVEEQLSVIFSGQDKNKLNKQLVEEVNLNDVINYNFSIEDQQDLVKAVSQGKLIILNFKGLERNTEPFKDALLGLGFISGYLAQAIELNLNGNFRNSQEEIQDIIVELATNAFRHGNKLNFDLPVALYFKLESGKISQMQVIDSASSQQIEPQKELKAREASISGFGSGISMIKNLFGWGYERVPLVSSESSKVIGTKIIVSPAVGSPVSRGNQDDVVKEKSNSTIKMKIPGIIYSPKNSLTIKSKAATETNIPFELRILTDIAYDLTKPAEVVGDFRFFLCGGTAAYLAMSILYGKISMPYHADVDIAFMVPEDKTETGVPHIGKYRGFENLYHKALKKAKFPEGVISARQVDILMGIINNKGDYVFQNVVEDEEGEVFSIQKLAVTLSGVNYYITGLPDAISDLKKRSLRILNYNSELIEAKAAAKLIGKWSIYAELGFDFDQDVIKEHDKPTLNLLKDCIRKIDKDQVVHFVRALYDYSMTVDGKTRLDKIYDRFEDVVESHFGLSKEEWLNKSPTAASPSSPYPSRNNKNEDEAYRDFEASLPGEIERLNKDIPSLEAGLIYDKVRIFADFITRNFNLITGNNSYREEISLRAADAFKKLNEKLISRGYLAIFVSVKTGKVLLTKIVETKIAGFEEKRVKAYFINSINEAYGNLVEEDYGFHLPLCDYVVINRQSIEDTLQSTIEPVLAGRQVSFENAQGNEYLVAKAARSADIYKKLIISALGKLQSYQERLVAFEEYILAHEFNHLDLENKFGPGSISYGYRETLADLNAISRVRFPKLVLALKLGGLFSQREYAVSLVILGLLSGRRDQIDETLDWLDEQSVINDSRGISILSGQSYNSLLVSLGRNPSPSENLGSEKKGNSSPAVHRLKEAPGGIDFRAVPIITNPVSATQMIVPNLNLKASSINLDKEWTQIQALVNSGIIPSCQRIKDYLQASCSSDDSSQRMEKMLTCIADMLRLEEEQVVNTSPDLKQLIALLESDKPKGELQLVLSSIK